MLLATTHRCALQGRALGRFLQRFLAADYPGGYADEEWYGIHSIALNPQRAGQPGAVVLNGVHYPDVLTPRAAADVLKALWTAPA